VIPRDPASSGFGFDRRGRPKPPHQGDEIATLTGFLEHQRGTLAWKCRGLDDAQLRTSVAPTSMTLGGLLLHLARVEHGWIGGVVAGREVEEPWSTLAPGNEWEEARRRSGDEVRLWWAREVERSRRTLEPHLSDGAIGLAAAYRVGSRTVSLRWILVHLIEEYARHNGHADLLRQSIDGEVGD
jgi:uncharacterized damage-inducible protein DinB